MTGTKPARCHCGSVSWERSIEENRYTCCSCKRPMWQPMETAPKNEKTILVYGRWCPGDTYFDLAFTHWDPDDEAWIFDGEDMLEMLYWMHLPDPPK